jgi:ABC-2 type transport system permease protein
MVCSSVVRAAAMSAASVVQHQPVTPVTEAVRGLLLGTGADAWPALAWCGGILAVSVAASSVLFRWRTA